MQLWKGCLLLLGTHLRVLLLLLLGYSSGGKAGIYTTLIIVMILRGSGRAYQHLITQLGTCGCQGVYPMAQALSIARLWPRLLLQRPSLPPFWTRLFVLKQIGPYPLCHLQEVIGGFTAKCGNGWRGPWKRQMTKEWDRGDAPGFPTSQTQDCAQDTAT